MNIAITFRHMESTDAVKSYASEKVSKIQRFLRQPMKAQVTLSCQSRVHNAEVDVHAGHDHYHAHLSTDDMYAAIDGVVDKIEAQIRSAHTSKKGGDRASSRLLPDVGDE